MMHGTHKVKLLIYIYIYTHAHTCCAFVGLDNKLYKIHGTYIKTPGVVLEYWRVLNNGYKAQSFERSRMKLDKLTAAPQENS